VTLHRSDYDGFTLVELMVTIAILAILAAIAAPAIDQMMRRVKLDADTERLQSALALARSEAVKRNTTISIIPSNSGFVGGWQIITDNAANLPNCALSTADGEQLLRVQDALSATTTFVAAKALETGGVLDCDAAPTIVNACISFDGRGAGIALSGASLTQTLCLRDSVNPDSLYRAITLNRAGQSYLVKVKN
jgi:prepilin-type N-terminal cleavage/methylation domain-containing protein